MRRALGFLDDGLGIWEIRALPYRGQSAGERRGFAGAGCGIEGEGSSGAAASAAQRKSVRGGMDSWAGTLIGIEELFAGKIIGLGSGVRLSWRAPPARCSSFPLSSWFLNSLLAFLNSARAFPNCRPNSGSFLGPKKTRANKKMKIISGMPRFIELMIMPDCVAADGARISPRKRRTRRTRRRIGQKAKATAATDLTDDADQKSGASPKLERIVIRTLSQMRRPVRPPSPAHQVPVCPSVTVVV